MDLLTDFVDVAHHIRVPESNDAEALRLEPCGSSRIGNNLFTGDVLFAEGCGICMDVPSAFAMYDSLERLKRRLHPDTHIFPGHTYVRPPGQKFSEVLRCNMYLQFNDRESFAAYRLRKGQTRLLDFV